MINLPHIYNAYNKPTIERVPQVIAKNNRVKRTRTKKQDKEAERLRNKANSPGVPPNSCPYIDMVKTIVDDMGVAYERLYEKGEHQPKMDELKQLADDQLEYIRRANECLRDNSAYWYQQYKTLLNK
jgi:type II secretory pathway component PulM